MTGTVEQTRVDVAVLPVLEVDGDEILSEFAKVMLEWGFYKTAAGLTFPSLEEAAQVAAGRRDDRGWNRRPLT